MLQALADIVTYEPSNCPNVTIPYAVITNAEFDPSGTIRLSNSDVCKTGEQCRQIVMHRSFDDFVVAEHTDDSVSTTMYSEIS